MLKAVLFDMDGVIVDTEPLHHKAYHAMFKEVDIPVSKEQYQAYTGQSTINICKDLCEKFSLSEAPETLMALKRKHFKTLFTTDDELKLITGVEKLIVDFYENDTTLILASSASMATINAVFDRFDLNKYFKGKLSGADLEASKPHPEIFEKAAETAQTPKQNCIVIEDSTNGVKAAHAAGIYCVGYNSLNSKNQDYRLANTVIENFHDFSFHHANKLLKNLNDW